MLYDWNFEVFYDVFTYFTMYFYFSVNDDCTARKSNGDKKDSSSDVFTMQLNSLLRGVGGSGGSNAKNNFFNNNNKDSNGEDDGPPQQFDASCYLENGKINFGKLITDEVLAADHKLVEAAKKTVNISKIFK